VLGELFIPDCPRIWTIERPWRDNIKQQSCIPEGEYGLKVHTGRIQPAILIDGVPNRTAILFHSANYASELMGCIAPGLHWRTGEPPAVLNSKAAMATLMERFKADNERGVLRITTKRSLVGGSMKLFIDCEWNSYRGELISIALVPLKDDRPAFYGAIPPPENLDPWAAENVMPVIGEPTAFSGEVELGANVARYLQQFRKAHIIADWPEDIERFCRLLICGPGERFDTPPLTMEVLRIDAKSKTPHNALADAVALRDAYKTSL